MARTFEEGLIRKVRYQEREIVLTINDTDFTLPLIATTDERVQIAMACEHQDKVYYALSGKGEIEQILLPVYNRTH
ncbi:MAG: hypothetical protein PHH00_03610 [Candidatus Nanoarchaeia archaeon]|nr:hypothetical protein [Candidatus Nanoarchaeia archaeon]